MQNLLQDTSPLNPWPSTTCMIDGAKSGPGPHHRGLEDIRRVVDEHARRKRPKDQPRVVSLFAKNTDDASCICTNVLFHAEPRDVAPSLTR